MSSSLVLILSIILSGTSVLLYNISVFQKSKRHIVGMHVGCNICDILMYLVTGGRIGMVNSVVNLCKNAVYAKWENRILTVLFSGLRIFLIMLVQEGSFTMLFVIFEVYITIAMLFGTEQQLRFIHLGSQITWVFYDYTFANIFVACITATSCISLVSAIIKKTKVKKNTLYKSQYRAFT